MVLWKPTRSPRPNTKTRSHFHHREFKYKIENEEIPGVTGKVSPGIQNEAEQRVTRVLSREHTCHKKHPFPRTQEMTLHMDITRCQMRRNQIDYIVCSQRWRSSIQLAKTKCGTDCGSDHELFVAKFMLKLKKVGKTYQPFRYDLNKMLYDYTVEVTDRLKGLDLADGEPEEPDGGS